MNDIIIFEFSGSQVRTVVGPDDKPWFVAADVAKVLELTKLRSQVANLHPAEKGVHSVDTPGGRQKVQIVNESGLYKLIFVSRTKAAVRFQDWIASEVIPSILRTGRYELSGQDCEITFTDEDLRWLKRCGSGLGYDVATSVVFGIEYKLRRIGTPEFHESLIPEWASFIRRSVYFRLIDVVDARAHLQRLLPEVKRQWMLASDSKTVPPQLFS